LLQFHIPHITFNSLLRIFSYNSTSE